MKKYELKHQLTQCRLWYLELLSMLKDWIAVQEEIELSHRIFKFPFEQLTRVEGEMAALEDLCEGSEIKMIGERRCWTDIIDEAKNYSLEVGGEWEGARVYLTLSFPSEVAADALIKAAKMEVANEDNSDGAYTVTVLDFIKAEKPTKFPGLLFDLIRKLDRTARRHGGALENFYIG